MSILLDYEQYKICASFAHVSYFITIGLDHHFGQFEQIFWKQ